MIVPERIVLASSNPGKRREIEQVLGAQFTIIPQSQFNIADAIESGLSFVENAIIKARHAAQLSGMPALADDSGLEVDALNGEPGIYSARYAGPAASAAENVQRLLAELAGIPEPERGARFRCVIVFLSHARDATPLIFQGSWEGRILKEPRGEGGFGYDPVFFVPGQHCSAAELIPDLKNSISHRGKALSQLRAALTEAGSPST